jgi:drug/metabolite transporter (DMT)-like permease
MLLGSALGFAVMAVLARLVSRPSVPEDARFDAGQLTVIRFAMGAAISLAVFHLRPGLYRPHNRRLLWQRGLSGGIVVVLYFLALQRIPAGEAGMLFNLFPVIAVLLSMTIRRHGRECYLGGLTPSPCDSRRASLPNAARPFEPQP